MPSVSESALSHIHIPQFDCVVHRAGEKEVTGIMVCNFPNRLSMFCESLGAASPHEIPDLNGTIARGCCKKITLRVELDAANPVDVALTAHDKVAIGDTPELPCRIITASCDDILLRVVAERCDTHKMPFEGLVKRKVGANSLIFFLQGRVEAVSLWDGSWLVSLIEELSGGSRGSLRLSSHWFGRRLAESCRSFVLG